MTRADLSRAMWRKSSRSPVNGGSQDCVEVAQVSGITAVRDSKNPAGRVLMFTPAAWSTFQHATKNGAFDRA